VALDQGDDHAEHALALARLGGARSIDAEVGIRSSPNLLVPACLQFLKKDAFFHAASPRSARCRRAPIWR